MTWMKCTWCLLAVAGTVAPGLLHAQGSGAPRTPSRNLATAPPLAQPGGGGPAKPARPAPAPFRVPQLSPEMEQVLQEWEAKSSKIKKLSGTFERYTYDTVFEVEKRGEGAYVYFYPDKGAYRVEGTELSKGDKSDKRGADGKLYLLKPDTVDHWVCDGTAVFKIDEQEKTFEKMVIPPEKRGENIMDGPLPFLFGMKAEKAKMRYEFKLVQRTEARIWVQVKPLWPQDAQNWQLAEVMLDPEKFLPKAVRLIDPPGTKTTVHVFNGNRSLLDRFRAWAGNDPLKPDLARYRQTIEPQGGEPLPDDMPRLPNRQPIQNAITAPPRKTTATSPGSNAPRSADASQGKAGYRPVRTQ